MKPARIPPMIPSPSNKTERYSADADMCSPPIAGKNKVKKYVKDYSNHGKMKIANEVHKSCTSNFWKKVTKGKTMRHH